MKLTASSAIASTLSGTLPVEAPTPRLSKVITRCRRGDAVNDAWVPVVQVRREVDVRKITGVPAFRAELAVGEVHAPGSDDAGAGRSCTT